MLVKFFATFCEITKKKEIVVGVVPTLQDLLESRVLRYDLPDNDNFLLQEGKLHPDVILLVNGRAVEHMQGLDTRLAVNDVVSIFPCIAGG